MIDSRLFLDIEFDAVELVKGTNKMNLRQQGVVIATLTLHEELPLYESLKMSGLRGNVSIHMTKEV